MRIELKKAQLPSKERLELLANPKLECTTFSKQERAAMARALLEAHEQEPVEYATHVVDDGVGEFSDRMNFSLPVGTKLYTHPAPVPAVPAKWPEKLTWSHHDDMTQAEVLAWNNAIDACLSAMLNGGTG